MGLTTSLNDVGTSSIPILLVATAACCVSYLRSLLLHLLHPFLPQAPTTHTLNPHLGLPRIGCGLAGLFLLAEQLNTHRPFFYPDAGEERECVVCLCLIKGGESVRRLGCCHVFHKGCLDGWFDQMKLSCPLCRSPLVGEERRSNAERRVGADLVAWLASYWDR